MSKTTNKFSPEVRARAVRMVLDNEGQHGSRWQSVMSIAAKIGCAPQTLNDWVKKAEIDSGRRPGVSSEMSDRMKALERENRELRQVEPWERHWSERPWRRPICSLLPIAPSTYYDHLVKRSDPARLSDRARRDAALQPEIRRVFEANYQVYGVRKGEPLKAPLVRAQWRAGNCAVRGSTSPVAPLAG